MVMANSRPANVHQTENSANTTTIASSHVVSHQNSWNLGMMQNSWFRRMTMSLSPSAAAA